VAGSDSDPGTWLPGLTSFERSVVDRIERERDTDEGRVLFGRYAGSHPGALSPRSDGGRSDGNDLVDTFISAAEDFDIEPGEIADAEREKLADALEESQRQSLERAYKSATVAQFLGTVPDGGMKTNRNNEIVLTLVVDWKDRNEIYRVLEEIPMTLMVTVEKLPDAP
jgi:hypothetical protein